MDVWVSFLKKISVILRRLPVSGNSGADGIFLCQAGFRSTCISRWEGTEERQGAPASTSFLYFYVPNLARSKCDLPVLGIYHGFFLMLEEFIPWLRKKGGRVKQACMHVYTLLVVCIGFVFFRADTIGQRDSCG